MGELTSTVTCRAGRGADPATGEVITATQIARRVGWAISLAHSYAQQVCAVGYTPHGLGVVAGKVGPDGRRLPSSGHVAVRRLGWAPQTVGMYLPDRFRRCAEEAAMRGLRQATWAGQVIAGIVGCWPQRPKKRTSAEWDALWAAVPAGTDKTTVRNRTRQIMAYLTEHGRLPGSICDLEPDLNTGQTLLLAAADTQLVRVQRPNPRQLVLHVKLPTVAYPQTRQDWAWHALPIRLPAHVPDHATLHAPTLRLVDGRVRVDLPWTEQVPTTHSDGHVRAVGFDWGVNTLITAAIAQATPDGSAVAVDGKPAHFNTAGATAKNARLRRQREQLAGRRDRISNLAAGLTADHPQRQRLDRKRQLLTEEIGRVSARQRQLNRQIAWAAARWLVDLAADNHATVIYAEDLRTMEARGLGRTVNTRASNTVRGQILDALRHLGARAGIAVVEVPAKDTSKLCPRCHTRLTHVPSPDRSQQRGHTWALCPTCGFSADRDHAAAERIVSRGLASQQQVRAQPRTHARRVVGHHDVKVRRSKRRRTPQQPRRTGLSRPVPANSTPAVLQTASGGTVSNGPAPSGSEIPHTVLTPRQVRHHRQKRRACGRGFHQHVHASPTQTRPDWHPHHGHPTPRRSPNPT